MKTTFVLLSIGLGAWAALSGSPAFADGRPALGKRMMLVYRAQGAARAAISQLPREWNARAEGRYVLGKSAAPISWPILKLWRNRTHALAAAREQALIFSDPNQSACLPADDANIEAITQQIAPTQKVAAHQHCDLAGNPACAASSFEGQWAQQRIQADLMNRWIAKNQLIAKDVRPSIDVFDSGFDTAALSQTTGKITVDPDANVTGHRATHGTAIVGLIAGSGGNGVAPDAQVHVHSIMDGKDPKSLFALRSELLKSCAESSAQTAARGLTVINLSANVDRSESRKIMRIQKSLAADPNLDVSHEIDISSYRVERVIEHPHRPTEAEINEVLATVNAQDHDQEQIFEALGKDLLEKGCLLVQSAGNQKQTSSDDSSILKVEAGDASNQRASFSGEGSVRAPGDNIFTISGTVASTCANAANGVMGGTSLSSPMVAGVVAELDAVLRSGTSHGARYAQLSPPDRARLVRQLLAASAGQTLDAQGKLVSDKNISALRAAVMAQAWRDAPAKAAKSESLPGEAALRDLLKAAVPAQICATTPDCPADALACTTLAACTSDKRQAVALCPGEHGEHLAALKNLLEVANANQDWQSAEGFYAQILADPGYLAKSKDTAWLAAITRDRDARLSANLFANAGKSGRGAASTSLITPEGNSPNSEEVPSDANHGVSRKVPATERKLTLSTLGDQPTPAAAQSMINATAANMKEATQTVESGNENWTPSQHAEFAAGAAATPDASVGSDVAGAAATADVGLKDAATSVAGGFGNGASFSSTVNTFSPATAGIGAANLGIAPVAAGPALSFNGGTAANTARPSADRGASGSATQASTVVVDNSFLAGFPGVTPNVSSPTTANQKVNSAVSPAANSATSSAAAASAAAKTPAVATLAAVAAVDATGVPVFPLDVSQALSDTHASAAAPSAAKGKTITRNRNGERRIFDQPSCVDAGVTLTSDMSALPDRFSADDPQSNRFTEQLGEETGCVAKVEPVPNAAQTALTQVDFTIASLTPIDPDGIFAPDAYAEFEFKNRAGQPVKLRLGVMPDPQKPRDIPSHPETDPFMRQHPQFPVVVPHGWEFRAFARYNEGGNVATPYAEFSVNAPSGGIVQGEVQGEAQGEAQGALGATAVNYGLEVETAGGPTRWRGSADRRLRFDTRKPMNVHASIQGIIEKQKLWITAMIEVTGYPLLPSDPNFAEHYPLPDTFRGKATETLRVTLAEFDARKANDVQALPSLAQLEGGRNLAEAGALGRQLTSEFVKNRWISASVGVDGKTRDCAYRAQVGQYGNPVKAKIGKINWRDAQSQTAVPAAFLFGGVRPKKSADRCVDIDFSSAVHRDLHWRSVGPQ